MARATPNWYFWKGLRDGAPFILVAGPFGMLFGVLAAEAGLALFETMTFSVTVFAGAAQFTALQLMHEAAPTTIILISALAVNLRMAMYSASLTPWLGAAPLWQRACAAYLIVDQSCALSITRFENYPDMTTSQRLAYFFGISGLVAPAWYLATLFGALMGSRIPETWALDFVMPVAFLAMIAPMLRTVPHLIAALTASVMALATAGMPFNLGLIVAGFCGMVAGAQAELLMARRKVRA